MAVRYTDEVFGHSATRSAVPCPGYHVFIVAQIADNNAVNVRGACDDDSYQTHEFGDGNMRVIPTGEAC